MSKRKYGYNSSSPIRSPRPIMLNGSISESVSYSLIAQLSRVEADEQHIQDYMLDQLPEEQREAAAKRLREIREKERDERI